MTTIDDTRSRETCIDALQQATLLLGALRRSALADLDALAQTKIALERAIAALRPGARHV